LGLPSCGFLYGAYAHPGTMLRTVTVKRVLPTRSSSLALHGMRLLLTHWSRTDWMFSPGLGPVKHLAVRGYFQS